MYMSKNTVSIIDIEDIEAYEKDTGKSWREDVEERMAQICSFYDYGFNWNEKGNIVINNGFGCDWHQEFYKFFGKNIEKTIENRELRHYEYMSAEKMLTEWLPICKATNDDYTKNGQNKPFPWV